MARVPALCLAALLLAAPLPARADGCLLCGGGAVPLPGGAAGVIGADARPPIEIDIVSGFNFHRFVAGDVLVDAGRSGFGGGRGSMSLVGQVVIRGAPHAALSVELPRSIVLASKRGGRIVIPRIATTLPRNAELDANGRLEFSFEGAIAMPARAMPGDYQASISIDAVYQ